MTDKQVINDDWAWPRRAKVPFMFPAEIAIDEAIQKIEVIGADERLTKAQMLLQEARNLVSDYLDEKIH